MALHLFAALVFAACCWLTCAGTIRIFRLCDQYQGRTRPQDFMRRDIRAAFWEARDDVR